MIHRIPPERLPTGSSRPYHGAARGRTLGSPTGRWPGLRRGISPNRRMARYAFRAADRDGLASRRLRPDARGRELAEELGFESVWYEDHFSLLECMSTLAALAASTRKVRLGVLVVGVPYRNPALIAKMWTTLDVISAGRAMAGFCAGWNEQEFNAYGYEFGYVG